MAKTRRIAAKSNLPKQIKISAYRIPVLRPKELDEGRAIGMWDPEKGVIYIQRDLRGAAELATFLHEVAHAISDIYNLRLSHNAVHIIGEAMAQVLVEAKP